MVNLVNQNCCTFEGTLSETRSTVEYIQFPENVQAWGWMLYARISPIPDSRWAMFCVLSQAFANSGKEKSFRNSKRCDSNTLMMCIESHRLLHGTSHVIPIDTIWKKLLKWKHMSEWIFVTKQSSSRKCYNHIYIYCTMYIPHTATSMAKRWF